MTGFAEADGVAGAAPGAEEGAGPGAGAERAAERYPLPEDAGAYGLLGSAWVRAVQAAAGGGARDTARLARGRAYAREGGVFTVRVGPGRVSAYVSGSRPRPYRAQWRLPPLPERGWHTFLETLAARPAHVAAVLDGAIPPQALAEAASAGARLLPAPGDLTPVCSCPDQGSPCKHAAALGYEAGRLLDSDPGLLFRLRGRAAETVREELLKRATAYEATTLPGRSPEQGRSPGLGPLSTGREPQGAAEPHGGVRPGPEAEPPGGGPAPGPDGARPAERAVTGADPVEESAPDGTTAPGGSDTPGSSGPIGTVLAREVFATSVRPPLPAPLPPPKEADEYRAVYPELAGAPSADALAFLAADAATRARLALSAVGAVGEEPDVEQSGAGAVPGPDPLPELSLWHDTIRLAATHPRLTGRRTLSPLFAALARTAGREALELARAAAAWRQGGQPGLEMLDTVWDPPAGPFDRGRSALAALGITMTIHRNRLTHTSRPVQLRYGKDGRWYPYRAEPAAVGDSAASGTAEADAQDGRAGVRTGAGAEAERGAEAEWWPEGTAAVDPVRALTGLRER
ncbi:SWIM zinc finger family protein [Streptomyces tubbatahanensis]|uniref:SWIM zinc finger family protein n=1 Tax=Streptomyces tubbatahanensis TaxID=2923272 RepID=A0ABY3XPR6_9ACTN|nr:SWIM zinc finger family protein [Streptomyces tubbatahanensis]UNS96410.1 SWIM zinc finger family protein [Streptomyces tubbatahanensis]